MAKLNCEYAIGTYEINLLTKNERKAVFDSLNTICEYIDTAINYDNDYLLSKYKNNKIISKIAPCHYDCYDLYITEHLKCLQRDKIDIMLIHNNRGNWKQLAMRMNNDNRFEQVGVSNFTIKDLVEYKNLIGKYPAYNEIEINPKYTDYETVMFCKNNDIRIIAYCILGGKYNAMKFVADYSLEYLMSYAENYADILILRADSEKQANDFVNVALNFDKIYQHFVIEDCDKSMQPLKYPNRTIPRIYKGIFSYYTANCKAFDEEYMKQYSLKLDNYKKYEMLGDIKALVRYLNNDLINYNKPIYDNDILLLKDGRGVTIQIFNEFGNLTKVINENSNIRLTYYLKKVNYDKI